MGGTQPAVHVGKVENCVGTLSTGLQNYILQAANSQST